MKSKGEINELGKYLGTEYGEISVYDERYEEAIRCCTYYADNVMAAREVSFSVPDDEWSEFENSQLYRDLVQYCEDVRQRIRCKKSALDAAESEPETVRTNRKPPGLDGSLSFWVQVRTLLRKILRL